MPKPLLDLESEFGARAERRLREDIIGWLVTVNSQGGPQPRPVWFIWDGETLLVYSIPGRAKVRHIEGNPAVALHLETGENGEDVVIVTGTAALDTSAPPIDKNQAYLDKYGEEIKRIGFEEACGMAEQYSVAIRIIPGSIRSF